MSTETSDPFVHRWPFFYGWIIATVGTIGLIMTGPGQSYVLSIFNDAMIEDLGLSRSLISSLFTAGTVVAGLSLSFWGQRIDRYGPRTMTSVIVGLFGIACIYMAFVRNAVMLGIGYVALRMLGASALGLASRNVINQWWVDRRGMVNGISGVAASLLGMGLLPSLVHSLVQSFDWRTSYLILGAVELGGMLPLGLLLIRDRPEEHGLEPDGNQSAEEDDPSTLEREAQWTLDEAVRTPAFWTAALSVGTTAMLGTGLFFHMVSIFEQNGLSAAVAASVYAPISITRAVVRLGSGFLADRYPLRFLFAAGMLFLASALGLVQIIHNVPTAMIYGVVYGVNSGLIGTVASVVWADYYGRRHLGAIGGLASTISRIASALGPLPLGIAYDLVGGYNLVLTIGAAIPAALVVANLLVKPPDAEA